MREFTHNISLGAILVSVGISIVSGWYDIITNWDNLLIMAKIWPVLMSVGFIVLIANLLLKK